MKPNKALTRGHRRSLSAQSEPLAQEGRNQVTNPSNAMLEFADTLAQQGVRWILGAYSDIAGRGRGKVVPVHLLAEAVAGSEHYTPRGLDGLGEMTSDEECYTLPDPKTLRVLETDRRIGVMAADLMYQGRPYALCPRRVLKEQIDIAAGMGYRCLSGIETEFYVFREDSCEPGRALMPLFARSRLHPTPAYDAEATIDAFDFLDAMAEGVEAGGFGLYSFDQEGGEGQYEFDFAHDDALSMADKVLFFRLLAKTTARKFGGIASFMPKPSSDHWGSGAHLNMSLVSEDGTNVFVSDERGQLAERDAEQGNGWSEECYHFIAGILEHAPALSALTCPSVNSYKRIVPVLEDGGTSWAPTHACFGVNEREAMIRLPANRPAIENRLVDSASNPYLAIAAMLGCGLRGIKEKVDPEPYRIGHGERNMKKRLPSNLSEALDALEEDKVIRDLLSEELWSEYLRMKRREWSEYHTYVGEWERQRYLTAY